MVTRVRNRRFFLGWIFQLISDSLFANQRQAPFLAAKSMKLESKAVVFANSQGTCEIEVISLRVARRLQRVRRVCAGFGTFFRWRHPPLKVKWRSHVEHGPIQQTGH